MGQAILVTGATGNVGQYVVKYLEARNQSFVVAGSRTESLYEHFPKAKAVFLDFENPETFEAALDGIDRVFLMRPPQIGDADVFQPFVDAMARQSIRLVAFLSLMGVERNPFPPHHKIEKMIEAAGIPYVHIRPGFFMQNLTGVHAKEIQRDDMIYIPAGRSQVSFIDAEDIGKAVARMLSEPERHQNTAYTLTGPEALDYVDIANTLTLLTKRRITYARPSLLAYRSHYIHVRRFEPAYVNVTMALYVMTRLGTAKAVTDDFERLTGERPRTFVAFAKEHLHTFQP
ncbi:NmrA family NAD(P)-binding protein [Exiguobacterium sp. AM39-5BH]|uniref:NmrA family NAD(P)-binding protein n=1 Tax=Exiguobacterium sp. AM39-5BH TaxID=2292355 RepID=UPI000FE2121C|nr:NmrA family NAD(P)-binding protein [Exiguobacterium sp. AM39-5BH]RHB49304.1 NAD-dependent epimerase/dehydratase family protein [Exiguobacterium sp. AM39-5BH]